MRVYIYSPKSFIRYINSPKSFIRYIYLSKEALFHNTLLEDEDILYYLNIYIYLLNKFIIPRCR